MTNPGPGWNRYDFDQDPARSPRRSLRDRWRGLRWYKKAGIGLGAAFAALMVIGMTAPAPAKPPSSDVAASTAPSPSVSASPQPVVWTPSLADDAASTKYTTAVTIDVLANDRSVPSRVSGAAPTLTLASVAAPAHGSASVRDGKILYTPQAGFSGTDAFSYTAAVKGRSASAAVSVTVAAKPTPTPTPTPSATPASTPTRSAVPHPAPTRESRSSGASVTVVVNPGSFCSVHGDLGVTKKGTAMMCQTASDGRLRWKSVG
ncbi:Ig-like domain-containing protein [Mangrovactinospora gilvigrisea]|uniref:Ig-like domain-containing protein n=1 Tax=Mangrovactinospora gilvigrisea TaxID=1428644 RepID=UPI000A622979|nr:Ig-like domain-containing protein [Mangrovactinospora gilvigrisea]